jgi:hypothetical protein
MPAVSERQRRFMAMCANKAPGAGRRGCPQDMSKEEMREFSRKPEGGYKSTKRKRRKTRAQSAIKALMGA